MLKKNNLPNQRREISMEVKNKRQTLTRVLLGEDTFPIDTTSLDIEIRNTLKHPSDTGIWLKKAYFPSRPYITYSTTESGDVMRSEARDTIPCLILEPTSPDTPRGIIIAAHQHHREFNLGKSEPAGLDTGKDGVSMHYGLELAQRGFVVICYDFAGFEERQIDHDMARGPWGERHLAQIGDLDGFTLMGKHVSDSKRAIDVAGALYKSLPIGMIGHSLGAIVTYYTTALGESIEAAVANCGISTFAAVEGATRTQGYAWSPRGIRKEMGEMHQLLSLITPRPFLISAGEDDDGFPIEGTRNVYHWGQQFYSDKDRLQLFSFTGRHDFPLQARENAYSFLEEHLHT